jgi:hypothetical protein
LTYHLKEARRLYHTTGELKKLFFHEVYPKGIAYLESNDIVNDHVRVTQMPNAERYEHSYKTMMQEAWNNLHSPANPRNYFHGKLMPCGLDEYNNLVFQYEVHDYEERWKKYGIPLDK